MRLSMRSVVLFVISIFVLNGCQVYSNLYGTTNTTEQFVPDSSIKVAQEGIVTEVAQDESLSEDAKALAEELAKKIEANNQADQEPNMPAEPISSETEAAQVDVFVEMDAPVEDESSEPAQNPLAIIAQETDKVSLVPQASDPDGDTLIFAFTSPLDEKGEWQTTYGDAGEYTVTATASDGDLTTTKDILLIINKKEESPAIESTTPQSTSLEGKETDKIEFAIVASDLNNDPLSYEWKLDGAIVGDQNAYDYQTTYDDAGAHTIKVDVNDGTSTISHIWAIDVANLNRKPVLVSLEAIDAKETDTITISAQASDADEDTLTYSISDDRFTQNENVFVWKTDYNSAGTYTLTVTVSDGQDEVSQDVQVTVANVNRKPVILDITQK